MPQNPIPAYKVKQLLLLCLAVDFNKSQSAKRLKIARSSAGKYIEAFRKSTLTFSDIEHLNTADLAELLFQTSRRPISSSRKARLISRLSTINAQIEEGGLTILDAWREEAATQESAYKYSQFASLYANWRTEQGLPRLPTTSVAIKPTDVDALTRWRSSRDRRKWEVGIALLTLSVGGNAAEVSKKIERAPRTIGKWCSLYERSGIESLPLASPRKQSEGLLAAIRTKRERLIKIIHEAPVAYDINRASWSLQALSDAYYKVHGDRVSKTSISEYFISAGYRFKKAKKVLTSDDPTYRDKLIKITDTLSQLGASEKFFSIGEFGPFSVKLRGGVALVPGYQMRTIPQRQKSRGSLICTAALELSTNQITHFYSKKKDTQEMIKLLRRLIIRYRGQARLFVSWDSASWHASKRLSKAVDEINSQAFQIRHKTPLIDLMPLPSGAQFLNVIESVFSGMSRAILHNSNYQSPQECKVAINRYFAERNQAFLEHPRRAGKKIWGKERVEAVFREENNCKDPRWR
jgi:transposase